MPLADEALDDGDVDGATPFASSTTDAAYRLARKVEKRREPFDPLIEELPAIHQHERVDAALGDEPCGHDRLAECRGGRENARLIFQQCRGGALLLVPQLAMKLDVQRFAVVALVATVLLSLDASSDERGRDSRTR